MFMFQQPQIAVYHFVINQKYVINSNSLHDRLKNHYVLSGKNEMANKRNTIEPHGKWFTKDRKVHDSIHDCDAMNTLRMVNCPFHSDRATDIMNNKMNLF